MKITCLNAISEKGTSLMEGYEFTDDIKEADAVLVRSAKMHDMEIGGGLLSVARAGAGVNNIPLDDYAKKGIVVFNTPGQNANAVKELVTCALLLAARDVYGGMKWVEANTDDADIAKTMEKAKKQFAGTEIAGKTLAVVGLGAVGAYAAEAGLAMGMKVLGYDPFLSVNAAWRIDPRVVKYTDLKAMAADCDYLSVHVPATPDTNGMISAEIIAAMKPGSVILNYSRDVLVDEQALAPELENGHIAKYFSDFPNAFSVKMKNTYLTPHLGASTEEAEENCAVLAAKETMDYLENGNISFSVNYPMLDMGPKKGPRAAVLAAADESLAGKIEAAFKDCGIEACLSAKRGDVSYTLLELANAASDAQLEAVKAIEGVYRVRSI